MEYSVRFFYHIYFLYFLGERGNKLESLAHCLMDCWSTLDNTGETSDVTE